MEEMHRARYVGKGCEASKPPGSTTVFPDLHVVTNLEALQILSFGGFMKASLYRHDLLSHWPLVINSTFSPSPPQRSGGGTVSPLITRLVLLATRPHPQVLSKSHLINIKDTFIALFSWEVPRVWRALCQKGDKHLTQLALFIHRFHREYSTKFRWKIFRKKFHKVP